MTNCDICDQEINQVAKPTLYYSVCYACARNIFFRSAEYREGYKLSATEDDWQKNYQLRMKNPQGLYYGNGMYGFDHLVKELKQERKYCPQCGQTHEI